MNNKELTSVTHHTCHYTDTILLVELLEVPQGQNAVIIGVQDWEPVLQPGGGADVDVGQEEDDEVPEGHEVRGVVDVQLEDSLNQEGTNKPAVFILVIKELRAGEVRVLVLVKLDELVVKHVELVVGEEIQEVDVHNVG